MIFRQFFDHISSTYTYLISSGIGREALIIDPVLEKTEQYIQLLNQLKLKRFKIPSGEITNFPYLKYMGGLNKPIIMSTGMSTLREIQKAINVLISSGTNKKKITLLRFILILL